MLLGGFKFVGVRFRVLLVCPCEPRCPWPGHFIHAQLSKSGTTLLSDVLFTKCDRYHTHHGQACNPSANAGCRSTHEWGVERLAGALTGAAAGHELGKKCKIEV